MATAQTRKTEYETLRQKVAVLERRVASLERQLAPSVDRPTPLPNVDGLHDEMARVTNEVFPGPVCIEVTHDPEYPHDSYTVVHAQAVGEIREIEDRRSAWHERVTELSENCRLLRLSLEYAS